MLLSNLSSLLFRSSWCCDSRRAAFLFDKAKVSKKTEKNAPLGGLFRLRELFHVLRLLLRARGQGFEVLLSCFFSTNLRKSAFSEAFLSACQFLLVTLQSANRSRRFQASESDSQTYRRSKASKSGSQRTDAWKRRLLLQRRQITFRYIEEQMENLGAKGPDGIANRN